jgi:hypothetical protein
VVTSGDVMSKAGAQVPCDTSGMSMRGTAAFMLLRLMVVAVSVDRALLSSGWGAVRHSTSSSRLLGVNLAPTTCTSEQQEGESRL